MIFTINEQLGMRIAYLRKQKGWSQEELAFRAELNKNYLSDIERGTRNPTVVILERIANAFGIDLSDLFLGISTIAKK